MTSLTFDEIMNELNRIAVIRSRDTNKDICDFSPYIDEFYRYDKVETIKILSKCICCVRHQINKPVIYDKWIELDALIYDKYYEQEVAEKSKICNCKCRHYSRWICRTCE